MPDTNLLKNNTEGPCGSVTSFTLVHSHPFPWPHLSFITTWNWVTLHTYTQTTSSYLCPSPVFLLFKTYYLILLTPLVSLHLEVSKHTWIQILTYLQPTVSHSNNTLASTLPSSLLYSLTAFTTTTPAQLDPTKQRKA